MEESARQLLREAEMEQHEQALREKLGVERLSDLRALEPADLDLLNLGISEANNPPLP